MTDPIRIDGRDSPEGGLTSWAYPHLGRPETRITFSGRFDAGDSVADILQAALNDKTRVIAVRRFRSWRERLFSWPWRPWARSDMVFKRAMVVSQVIVGDDSEVTFTIVEVPPE